MADRRQFPDPDPALRHLGVEVIPQGWLAMSPYERSLRGRYALVGICAGLHPLLAWHYALDQSEASTKEIEQAILPLTDAQIDEMVLSSAGAQATAVAGYAPVRVA